MNQGNKWIPDVYGIAYFIATIGIFIAGAYSWSMTATGFLITKFLPANHVIPQHYIAFIVAFLIQSAIFTVYLILPHIRFNWQNWIKFSFLFSIFLLLICTSAIFSLVSITFNSYGQQLTDGRRNDIVKINNDIQAIDDRMTRIYLQHIDSLESLAQNFERGLDESRIATCGTKCRAAWAERNQLFEEFNATVGHRVDFQDMDNHSIDSMAMSTENNLNALHQKTSDFLIFAQRINIDYQWIKTQSDKLQSSMSKFLADRNGKTITGKDLAFLYVAEDLERLRQGIIDLNSLFRIVIVLLPDVLSTAFMLLIWIIKDVQSRQSDLKKRIELEKQLYSDLNTLNRLQKKRFEKENDLTSLVHGQRIFRDMFKKGFINKTQQTRQG